MIDFNEILPSFGWHRGMLMGEELEDEWFKDRAEIRLYDNHLVYYAHPEWVYGETYFYSDLTFMGDRLVGNDDSYIML